MTDAPKSRGILCPKCGGRMKRVKDSRDLSNNSVRRRRECPCCGHRLTTEERPRRPPAASA